MYLCSAYLSSAYLSSAYLSSAYLCSKQSTPAHAAQITASIRRMSLLKYAEA